MKTKYTWAYVISSLIKAPFDGAHLGEAWCSIKHLGFVIAACLTRILLVIFLPVTAPLFVFVMRREEKRRMAGAAARKAAMDADV